ncbi:MAG: hypothetical protein JSW08_01205 [archaeon]|nr:MAG: hypothetical protein JSW08_01205 [archaeon]
MGEGAESIIITVIVVLIVVGVTIFFVSKTYPGALRFLPFMKEKMDEETETKMEDNFETLIERTKACRDIDDYDCLCEFLPNYPGSFVKSLELSLYNAGRTLNIDLLRGKTDFRKGGVSDCTIQPMLLQINLLSSTENRNKLTLEFNKKFPFEKNTKNFVTSEYLFKDTLEVSFLLLTKNIDDVDMIKQEIPTLPICQDKRMRVINEFEDIKALIMDQVETTKTLVLAEEYQIKYSSNSMVLQKNGVDVKKITYRSLQSKTQMNTEPVKFEKVGLVCVGSKTGTLSGGQLITIKSQNNGCINV